jgi:hypothetical protein
MELTLLEVVQEVLKDRHIIQKKVEMGLLVY